MNQIKIGFVAGKGRGVFATKPFSISDIIERAPVIIVNAEEGEKITNTVLENYTFGWGENDFAVVLGYGSLYNHSFEPNAIYIRNFDSNEMIFQAICQILPEDELTINYNGDPDDRTTIVFDGHGGWTR